MRRIGRTFIVGGGCIALLCSSIILISCERKPQEIRIGLIVYTDDEVERSSTLNAASLAVDDINNGKGLTVQGQKRQIVIVREDVPSDVPEKSVEAVQKLINQRDVVAIVGPQFSSDAIPAGQIAETSRIPLISPISTNPKTTLNRKFVFRMGFNDDHQGCVAASFLTNDLGLVKLAVLYNVTNPYSRGIADVFRECVLKSETGKIVAFESYTSGDADLTLQLTRIRDAGPQAVYLPNISREAESIVVQVRKVGIRSVLMGGDGWDRTRFSKMPQFEGSYMTAHYSEMMDTPENETFVRMYTRRFGVVPGDTAALTYDAFRMVLHAMELGNSANPVTIRDTLYTMGPFNGVGGSINFTDTGDPTKGTVILQFHKGEVMRLRGGVELR